jgi:CHAD domain-containing protein
VTWLRDGCGLRAAACSKLETACAANGITVPEPAAPGAVAIGPTMPVGELALGAVRAAWAALATGEPGARLGDDPEALHEMRLATRRLRAALRLFADVLPRGVRRLRRQVSWAAAALGAVRDLDVELAALAAAELAEADRAALAAVQAGVRARRERARRRMLRALDSRRWGRAAAGVEALLARGPAPTRRARAPVAEVAPATIARCYRKVRRLGDRLRKHDDAAAYHALRISGKRLRYALEVHRGLYGKPLVALLGPVVELHQTLGRWHDAEVLTRDLRALCEGRRLSARAAFLVGTLAERERRRAAKLRRRARKLYRALRGARWLRRGHALTTRGGAAPRAGPRRKRGAAARAVEPRVRRGPLRAAPPGRTRSWRTTATNS